MSKYIDADALFRWIQTECNPYGKPTLDYETGCKILDHIRKMSAADVEPVREWISVDERLPESGSDVLAYYDNGIEARGVPVNFVNGIWYDCIFNKTCHAITHWMPLPGFPEDGGDS